MASWKERIDREASRDLREKDERLRREKDELERAKAVWRGFAVERTQEAIDFLDLHNTKGALEGIRDQVWTVGTVTGPHITVLELTERNQTRLIDAYYRLEYYPLEAETVKVGTRKVRRYGPPPMYEFQASSSWIETESVYAYSGTTRKANSPIYIEAGFTLEEGRSARWPGSRAGGYRGDSMVKANPLLWVNHVGESRRDGPFPIMPAGFDYSKATGPWRLERLLTRHLLAMRNGKELPVDIDTEALRLAQSRQKIS